MLEQPFYGQMGFNLFVLSWAWVLDKDPFVDWVSKAPHFPTASTNDEVRFNLSSHECKILVLIRYFGNGLAAAVARKFQATYCLP